MVPGCGDVFRGAAISLDDALRFLRFARNDNWWKLTRHVRRSRLLSHPSPSALYRTGSSPTEGRRDQKSEDAAVVMPSGARAWCQGAETCSGTLRFPLTTLLDFSASLEMTIGGSWRACEWLLGDEATVDGQGVTGKECIDRIREHCTITVHWGKSPSRPSPADWGRSQRASFNRTGGGQAKFSYQGKRCATASQ